MRTFHIAFTGDFLNEQGTSAYGDLNLAPLERAPHIQFRFLTEQAPKPLDAAYWGRFYSLEVTPAQLRGVDGLVVLRPWIKRTTIAAGGEGLRPSRRPVVDC